ncbi:hypothetical protein OSTOST_05749 [Ostertagia ostertagi]
MPGSPSPATRTSRQSSVDRCDSSRPSSSYYIPQPSSYIEVTPSQPSFLNSSTYGQISYEVDESSTFNYTYNPRRVMESNTTPVSKYLEDSPHYGQGSLDAPENLLLNAPASVPSNFSYISDTQEPEPLLNIPGDAHFETESVISAQSPLVDIQYEPDSLLSIPLPTDDTSFVPESLLDIPLPPGDGSLACAPLASNQSPPVQHFEPEPLLNIPLPQDDAQFEPVTLMNNRSLTDNARPDSEPTMNTQSPPDDARFSTPECTPDSIQPISAPLSSENQYVRSPSEKSDGSNLTAQEVLFVVGQPAKRASRKDAENVRYESPKNHDVSWIMEAFYSSSEEYNSPDNAELRKSNDGEEVSQLDTDDSDGRVSIVDRLFAMLQRAERESSDEDDDDEGEVDVQIPSEPPAGPSHGPAPIQSQFQPRISHYLEPSRLSHVQDPIQNIPQYPEHQMPMDYAENLYHPSQVAGTSYLPSMLPSTSGQYPPQHVPQQMVVGQNAQVPMRPAPDPPMFYNAPPPIYQGPPIHQLHQQFFPVGQPSFMPQFPSTDRLPQQLPYQEPWSINVYEPQSHTGMPEQVPLNVPELQPPPFSVQGSEEGFSSESPITLENSSVSSPSSSQTEYETSVDFESVSVVRSTPKVTEEEPRPKGPPFEQKGPTRTKEIGPTPPPPPPSPEDGDSEHHAQAKYVSIADQLAHETARLEDMSINEVANYDRQAEVDDLRKRIEEDNDSSTLDQRKDEGEFEDGDPEDGKVIRNGIQLTTRYLALWFPDKKERAEMIPWNIVRKIKPIRLCFLDNRIGHGEYEEFNMGEFVNVTGHMMFAYGDGPEALDETRLFMLDIVRQQMNMLLRRIWQLMMQNPSEKSLHLRQRLWALQKSPYSLKKTCSISGESKTPHALSRNGLIKVGDVVKITSKTEWILTQKGPQRAPHIYHALIEAGFEDQLEFLCEERRIQDCDPALAKIKLFLKKRNRHLSTEHKELLDYARRVSYCSRTGRLSAFRAHRFHEFLGFPDLQTDLIYILDFLAREIVMEVTYRAAQARQLELEKHRTRPSFMEQPISKGKIAVENLELCYYEEALRSSTGWRRNQDILFGEEEERVTLSYGKNPWKWESDHEYNKRELAERLEYEEKGPWPSRFAYVSSAELFEEHKKVLRGEYWDSCPEDLTKEAFVVANAYAVARQSQMNLPEPQVPIKWQQQNLESNKKEHERLKKLLETNRQSELEKRLTEQLVKMMAENNIDDTASAVETDGHTNLEKMTKLISAVVQKHQSITNA